MFARTLRRSLVAAAALSAACAGASCTSGKISGSGTVGGFPVPTAAGQALQYPTFDTFVVKLSSNPIITCDTTFNEFADVTTLALDFPTTHAAAGLYPGVADRQSVGSVPVAMATFSHDDARCGVSYGALANDGTITISSVTDSEVSGTFYLKFGADEISGQFTVPLCGPSTPPDPWPSEVTELDGAVFEREDDGGLVPFDGGRCL